MPAPKQLLERYGPWAVVTEASSGIGQQLSIRLAEAGFTMVLVARRRERLEALSKYICETDSTSVRVFTADLSIEAGWCSVVKETGHLDVGLLVDNAGYGLLGAFYRFPIDSHLNLIFLNVSASTALAYAFGRRFAGQGGVGLFS